MFALLTLLFAVTLSILTKRIATMALALTGLSRDEAQFQARSVSTGTGFTTAESEHITRHMGSPISQPLSIGKIIPCI